MRTGRHCQDKFDALFQAEFEKRYPDGMRVKVCKRKVLVRYYPASLGFRCDGLSHTFDVPDVTALVGPRRQLSKIAAVARQSQAHSHKERGDAGPITVCPAEEAKTFKIPKRVVLDHGKITAKLKESQRVSRMIQEIFEEESETKDGPITETAQSTGELDKEHFTLLIRLGEQESWQRSDYEKLVKEIGLLPDGALQTLNEAAYDLCDEPLTVGVDPILIDQDVYREVAG